MKILIAYYSRTGSTEKLAEMIEREFKKRGHTVDVEKIKPIKEHSFWYWWNLRIIKGECDIYPPKIKDVSKYDVICIGSPNWTRVSLPVAKYLKEIKGLEYKNIGFFATTALWPQIEWYILSAYLLDSTFSRIIEKRGGRIIDNILLSSFFKRWSPNSKYGEKIIKKFCQKLETPTLSLKSYFLKQKEIENNRLLIVVLSLFLFFSLLFQIITSRLGLRILSWNEYFYIFIIAFFNFLAILTMLAGKTWVFLGKYLTSVSLSAIAATIVLFLSPIYVIHGRSLFLGYILIFILISLFRDLKALIFTGLLVFLSYFYLFFNYPQKGIILPQIDIILLFLTLLTFSSITQNLHRHYIGLLEAQEEVEMAKTTLEIKVAARTRELKELSESLERQVKARTKELQEKIEQLEKFNKLAVGRELKMVELKKEIKSLKKEIENLKTKK